MHHSSQLMKKIKTSNLTNDNVEEKLYAMTFERIKIKGFAVQGRTANWDAGDPSAGSGHVT